MVMAFYLSFCRELINDVLDYSISRNESGRSGLFTSPFTPMYRSVNRGACASAWVRALAHHSIYDYRHPIHQHVLEPHG